MRLLESAEMYIETIYRLSQERSFVRSVDVADSLGYSKPSVSRAVSALKQDGYLTMDNSSHYLRLTDKGVQVAKKVYERHTVLSRLLISLGVDAQTASEDACRIEHVISDASFQAIKRRMQQERLEEE